MNIRMNAHWKSFKAHGIGELGREGFADWLADAAQIMRAEAKREAANARLASATERAYAALEPRT